MSFKSFTAEKKSNKLKLNIARTVDLEKNTYWDQWKSKAFCIYIVQFDSNENVLKIGNVKPILQVRAKVF